MKTKDERGNAGETTRLVLGTAQLGMPYGIANRTGQPDLATAVSIIKTAWDNGIREFDTAQAYGISECILGKAIRKLGISEQIKVITKLSPSLDVKESTAIHQSIEKSIYHLDVPSLYGLMLHRENWLDMMDQSFSNALEELVKQGTVQHLGVSCYSPLKALQALESDLFDMIQAPANVLDRRFETAGVFDIADIKHKKIYIRSVFLQGLLLLDLGNLPPHLSPSIPILKEYEHLCNRYGISRMQAALLFVKEKYPKTAIVIGTETSAQLKENLSTWSRHLPRNLFQDLSATFEHIDESFIDPNRWPVQ